MTKIVLNSKGISKETPLKSKMVAWNNIKDYGRDRILAGYGGMWRYYIKTFDPKKKVVLFQEDIIDFDTLHDYIINYLNVS
jgi:hypothetical protein